MRGVAIITVVINMLSPHVVSKVRRGVHEKFCCYCHLHAFWGQAGVWEGATENDFSLEVPPCL